MHQVELNAQSRSNVGKGAARSLRREGKVPAVMYGHGFEARPLAVESREGETRVGGARLENMLVVTKNGAEIMDYFPRDEILVAPR